MDKAKTAQAQAALPVRILSALYGSPEKTPFWALWAWREGWRPILRKSPTLEEAVIAANKEEVNTDGK